MIRSALHQLDDTIDLLLIVSDIHGFVRPLEVFDALHAAMGGRSQIVFNGDMCTAGLWPAEAMQWTQRNAGELAVLGNHDEEILQGAAGDYLSFSRCISALQRRGTRLPPEASPQVGLIMAQQAHCARGLKHNTQPPISLTARLVFKSSED